MAIVRRWCLLSAKRFIPISESVLSIAAKLAERSGTPLRDFIELVLSEVLKAMQFRSNVIEVISISDLLDDLRRLGAVVLPKDFVYRVLEVIDEKTYEELVEEIRRAASWYGTLVKVKRGPTVDTLRLVLNVWLPDMNVSVIGSGGKYKLVASSSKQPLRATRLAAVIIEELCRSLELKVSDVKVSQGIVSVVIEEVGGRSGK